MLCSAKFYPKLLFDFGLCVIFWKCFFCIIEFIKLFFHGFEAMELKEGHGHLTYQSQNWPKAKLLKVTKSLCFSCFPFKSHLYTSSASTSAPSHIDYMYLPKQMIISIYLFIHTDYGIGYPFYLKWDFQSCTLNLSCFIQSNSNISCVKTSLPVSSNLCMISHVAFSIYPFGTGHMLQFIP